MSAIFYDGQAKEFGKKQDEMIQDLLLNLFIEYLNEDLSKADSNKKPWCQMGQSLLDEGDEKHGLDRLHESL